MTAGRAFFDRVEGDSAVLLVGGREAVVPLDMLPEEASEGSWLKYEIEYDRVESAKSTNRTRGLIDRLTGSGESG